MSSVAFLGPQNAPKSLAAGALPQTPLKSLPRTQAPPQLGLKGLTSKAPTSKGKGWNGKGESGVRTNRKMNKSKPKSN